MFQSCKDSLHTRHVRARLSSQASKTDVPDKNRSQFWWGPWCLFSDKKLHWISKQNIEVSQFHQQECSVQVCVSSENAWKFTEQALFFLQGNTVLRKLYFNLNNIEPTSTKSLADLQVFVSVRSLWIRHKSTWPTKGKWWNPSLVFLLFFRKSRTLIWLKNWRNVVDRFPTNLVFFIKFYYHKILRTKKSALLTFIFGGFPAGFTPPPTKKLGQPTPCSKTSPDKKL